MGLIFALVLWQVIEHYCDDEPDEIICGFGSVD